MILCSIFLVLCSFSINKKTDVSSISHDFRYVLGDRILENLTLVNSLTLSPKEEYVGQHNSGRKRLEKTLHFAPLEWSPLYSLVKPMFSGIISALAEIKKSHLADGSLFLTLQKPKNWKLKPGDSIATNGVCLTVKTVGKNDYTTELMPETLKTTAFGQHVPEIVNLERPITLQTPLDGHLVLGHVDAVGKIVKIKTIGQSKLFTIEFPREYRRWVAPKGSITIDGVGLTVAKIQKNFATVSLVDYTLIHTNFSGQKVDDAVNIEFDIVAKYLVRKRKK